MPMSIQPYDGDLSKRICLNVEVDSPRAKPFVEPPLITSMHMDREISSFLSLSMGFRSNERFVIDGFPARFLYLEWNWKTGSPPTL